MKNYGMIRGKIAEDRCTNKSTWGSPLYCDCGCKTPHKTDPMLDLSNVTICRKSDEGYANFILEKHGKEIGNYNSQYGAIYINGHEFLGVDKATIAHLFAAVLAKDYALATTPKIQSAGSDLEETAAFEAVAEKIDLAEQDARNAKHPGYCAKCHTYCYGDCVANR